MLQKYFGAKHYFLKAFLAGPYCPAESFLRQLQQQSETNVNLSLSNPPPSLLAKTPYSPPVIASWSQQTAAKLGLMQCPTQPMFALNFWLLLEQKC